MVGQPPNVDLIRRGGDLRIDTAEAPAQTISPATPTRIRQSGLATSLAAGAALRDSTLTRQLPRQSQTNPPRLHASPRPSRATARLDSSGREDRFESQKYKNIRKPLGLDAANDPFAGHARIFIERPRTMPPTAPRANSSAAAPNSTAATTRLQPQVSSRPSHAVASKESHFVTQPKVQQNTSWASGVLRKKSCRHQSGFQ